MRLLKINTVSKPYVTALIGTYNQGRFIEEAVDCVLAQDFPQRALEIIVVDDGSTDDTRERVARYGDRLRYLYKPNGGQASALNAGFALAQGEIIALLDGDDVWLPKKVTATVEALEQVPDAVMAYHPMIYADARLRQVSLDESFCALSGNLLERMETALQYGAVSTSSMVLRRGAWDRLAPIPEGLRIYADSYLAYLAVFLGPLVALSEPLTHYRIHGQNQTSSADGNAAKLANRHKCFREAVAAIHHWLARNGIEVHSKPAAAFLQRQELVEQMLSFFVKAPGRLEFFRYLRRHNRLYSPLWTRMYRGFRAALALSSLALGYEKFHALQSWHASGGGFRNRAKWIPSRKTEVSQSNLPAPHVAEIWK